jgi:hypothetical protein
MRGELGEPGLKGDPGERGETGVKGDVGERGEPGAKGEPGGPGERGEHGEKGIAGERGETGVKGDVGERGAQGDPGVKGDPGVNGKNGNDGIDGKDGKSVTIDDVLPALDGAVAKWMLEVERRIMDMAQRAIEAMPKPRDGVDGKDGISASDFTFNFDHDTRTLSIRHGDRIVFSQRICIPKYIDVWTESFGQYEEGFVVTFGGHGWIAKRDTASKPGTDDSWQLFVKKGRDGK